MHTTTEIGKMGERLVAWHIKNLGYVTNIDTKSPDSTEIEAQGNTKSLLVQVKSAEHPNIPESLSAEEVSNLTSRAIRLGSEAWEARIQLNQQLRQVGDVQWRKLT